MDWTKPTTQMLGRFQPWHEGHTELFRRAHSKTGQVAIMLRTTEIDENNPYDIDERVMQIAEKLTEAGFETLKDYTILSVPNIVHITYGRDVGYKVEQETFDADIEDISATKIRKQMKEEGKL